MFARVIVFYIVKIIVVRFILANGISVNVHNNDLSHYKGPTTCVDPETGIKYSIEAEWVSQNAGNCYKMQCKRVTLFTIVNIIRISGSDLVDAAVKRALNRPQFNQSVRANRNRIARTAAETP
ncbi:hypothetical protein PGB90_008101 [Kerria lacca]